MDIIEIRDGRTGAFAKIAPALGWNCFEWQVPTSDGPLLLIDPPPEMDRLAERPSRYGVPLLFPFPNRIRQGRFEWNGRTYELPATDAAGNAIHGFCLRHPWVVASHSENSARGSFRFSEIVPDWRNLWPADFQIEVEYRLTSNGLRADVTITNCDTVPLPWGFGTHACFRLPLSKQSRAADCLVQVPAAEYFELEDALPTGRTRPVDEPRDLRDGAAFDLLKLDDILTAVDGSEGVLETMIMDEPAGRQLRQRASNQFRHVVAFTPPGRPVICLEPYTCATDAVNLWNRGVDTGWKVLPPGQTERLWWEFRLEPILV